MNRCRNCGGNDLQELGFIGVLAPFFLRRVFGMQLGVPKSMHPVKQLIRSVLSLPQRLFDRVNRTSVIVEMQLCKECFFVQTRLPFQEQGINQLYLDYRSDAYNRERTAYEPSYGAIAQDIGQGTTELEVRVTTATRFIKDRVTPGANFTILDYGGADGKFLPRLEGEKFVFDISDIPPITGVTRIQSEAEMGTYSLVQCTHVIEHVVQPLELVKHIAAKVAPGGYLYLETPQELTDAERMELKSGRRFVAIHEHINNYCVPAVSNLIESAGLTLVAIEAEPIDLGWAKSINIRALGKK